MAWFQRRLKTYYRPSDHLNYQFKWCPTHWYIPQPHLSSGRVVNLRSQYTYILHYIQHNITYIYIYIYIWCFGLRRVSLSPHPKVPHSYRSSLSLTHTHAHTPITVTYFICRPEPFQFVYYYIFFFLFQNYNSDRRHRQRQLRCVVSQQTSPSLEFHRTIEEERFPREKRNTRNFVFNYFYKCKALQ